MTTYCTGRLRPLVYERGYSTQVAITPPSRVVEALRCRGHGVEPVRLRVHPDRIRAPVRCPRRVRAARVDRPRLDARVGRKVPHLAHQVEVRVSPVARQQVVAPVPE